LAWTIEVSKDARKSLRKLGKINSDRITRAIGQIAESVDPRAKGKAMTGNYAGYWRYRVGDWRVIAKIEDDRLIVFVIEIGHRREVYR